MAKQLDRRVIRTRRRLREALLELVMEKDFDALTITEITERADLRRATFYLHYGTKEELLMSALQHIFDQLAEASEHMRGGDVIAGKTQPQAFAVTFDYVAQNAPLIKRLLGGSGGALVSRHIRDYLANLVMDSLRQLSHDPPGVPREVIAHYIAGTELALLTWWLESDMRYSPSQMADMAHRLVLSGVQGVLGEALTVPDESG